MRNKYLYSGLHNINIYTYVQHATTYYTLYMTYDTKKHIAYYDTPIVNPESDSVIKILVNQYFLSYSTAPTIQYTQHGANEVSESGEGAAGPGWAGPLPNDFIR